MRIPHLGGFAAIRIGVSALATGDKPGEVTSSLGRQAGGLGFLG